MVEQLSFQIESGGSIPTSPLQFIVKPIDIKTAVELNKKWHSRLPDIRNWFSCKIAYGAFYDNCCWAVALWGRPVARVFNGKPVLELRRMAIKDGSPKYTASRMLSLMVKDIKKRFPVITRLISYQDTEVHKGTIYKASNWFIGHITKSNTIRWGKLNKDGTGRKRNAIVATGDKIRWEYTL